MRTDQPAPATLELVREFVNTLDVEEATDALDSGAGAAAWLSAHAVGGPERPVAEADRRRLVEVREALRELLLANNLSEPAPKTALATLNEHAAATPVGLRFDAGGATLVPRGAGVDAAIADLLAIVYQAMSQGTWRRLKVCPAEDCRWAFYDQSRNRSGTWCEMGECGNRAKARRFRERHKPS
jgi:predicted RNA-binding Zn ribbon-like protein